MTAGGYSGTYSALGTHLEAGALEIFYYRDPKLNFGDDLNEFIWPALLSERALAADAVLIGIGSILSQEFAGRYSGKGRPVFVLGSGTSYDRPPRNMDGWFIEAVRGPLTGRIANKDRHAITDGAILLADIPEVIGPTQERTDIVFMPHHKTLLHTNWPAICAAAGMVFVSPQWPVPKVMAAYAKAKLVVTEAMHGAIVADTLRVPWIPVIISPAIDEFKWRDWTLSMEVPFEPVNIPAGDGADRRRFAAMRQIMREHKVAGHMHLAGNPNYAALTAYNSGRFSKQIKDELLRPISSGPISRAYSKVFKLFNARFKRQAIDALRAAAQGKSFLSSDEQFSMRLDQMREALRRVDDAAGGLASRDHPKIHDVASA